MHSPLLTRAILGDAVAKTMAASSRNRDNPGEYVMEARVDENTTFLRWQGTSKGTNREPGDADRRSGWKLKERTVAYRPFPALKIFHEKQRAATGDLLPPDMWEYATT
jgi:hypothetical protein